MVELADRADESFTAELIWPPLLYHSMTEC